MNMNRTTISTLVLLLALLLIGAWLIEAFFYGRGFISMYVAPLALVAVIVAALLRPKRR